MSGGGSPKNTTVTNSQTLDPAVKQMLAGEGGVYQNAQNLYAQGTGQYYPGSTYAGMNDVQYGALSDQLNALKSPAAQEGANAMMNAGRYGMTAVNPSLEPAATNPYLDSMVASAQNRNNQNFSNNIIPQINSGAQAAGQYGSSRHGVAEGLAAQGLLNANADTATNMYGGNYQFNSNLGLQKAQVASGLATDNLNRMTQGANAINAGAMAPVQNAQAAYNVGSTLQGEQQNQTGADIDRWNYYQGAPQANLGNYAGTVMGGAGIGAGQTQTGANPNYTSPGQGALGGAIAGGTTGASFGPWGAFAGAVGGGLLGYAGSR